MPRAPFTFLVLSIIVTRSCFIFCAEHDKKDGPPDPAESLARTQILDANELKAFDALFYKLVDTDFDERENALQRIIGRGPAIFPLADQFAKQEKPELAAMARQVRGKILLEYDGYLPVSRSLKRKLQQSGSIRSEGVTGTPLEALRKIAADNEIELLFDQRFQPSNQAMMGMGANVVDSDLGSQIQFLAQLGGMAAVPRGDLIIVSSPQVVEKLTQQRMNIDWSHLKLNRDEAARVGALIRTFFLPQDLELQTSSMAVSVRGSCAGIERAARVIGLLGTNAPATFWPATDQDLDLDAIYRNLATPTDVHLSREDLLYALEGFQKQNLQVDVCYRGRDYSKAPYPDVIDDLAPVKLKLQSIPLGLTLRWLAKRSQFISQEMEVYRLIPEVAPNGRIRIRVGLNERNVHDLAMGGVDASFLGWKEDGNPKVMDEVIQAQVVRALEAHLDLFPSVDLEKDLRVVRGRVLVQGSPAAVAWTIRALQAWKRDGKPPVCAWKPQLDLGLEREVDWDGSGFTTGNLLPAIRKLGGFSILLEDAPDGTAAHFKLTPQQAELLSRGKHTVKALLNDLVGKIKAKWEVRWGVVVISPILNGEGSTQGQ